MLPSKDEIQALLANPTAWKEVLFRTSSEGCECSGCAAVHAAIAAYADERAANLAQLLALESDAQQRLVRAALTLVEEVQLFGTHERIGALRDALRGVGA